ncbi:hypothetical protein OROMI_027736 [Orobanche minor]
MAALLWTSSMRWQRRIRRSWSLKVVAAREGSSGFHKILMKNKFHPGKMDDTLSLVLLIFVTKVAKSAFDKALAEHEDIDDVVGSEESTERDHGVDLQQPLLIKIDSSDSYQK